MGVVIFSVLVFLGVLSVLVLVHELGHFLMARRAGIKVEEFGFGLPPKIWGIKIGETVYSLNLLPIGGFVRMLGEESETEIGTGDRERTFVSKSKLTRIAVVVAGVVMNFLLAIGVFTFLYTRLGIPTKVEGVYIVGIVERSPAETAGFKVGDKVLDMRSVDPDADPWSGLVMTESRQFIEKTKSLAGQEIEVLVAREISPSEHDQVVLRVRPRENPPPGEGPLGVAISSVIPKFFSWWQMPFRASYQGVVEAFGWTKMVVLGMGKLFIDLVSLGKLPSEVSGPVGIFQVTTEVAKTGWLNLLQLVGILSVNLAVLNILPLPALDGGRLAFIVLEGLVGKKFAPKYERWVHSIGLVILIGLILAITYQDIVRLLSGQGPGG